MSESFEANAALIRSCYRMDEIVRVRREKRHKVPKYKTLDSAFPTPYSPF